MFHLKKRLADSALPGPDAVRELINEMDEAVVVLASDREIRYMNSAAKRVWGEREGERCHKVLRESVDTCRDCPLDGVLSSRGLATLEMRMSSVDGWQDRENLYMRVGEPGAAIDHVVILSSNIDARKSLERQVGLEKGLKEKLLDSVSELAIGVGAAGELLFANQALERVSGYTEREMLDGGIELIIPEDSRENARELFAPAGEPILEPILLPLITRDGERRMISWTYSSLKEGDAERSGIVLGQDVTARFAHRKEAERRAEEFEAIANQRAALLESLQESEERYRTLVDNSLIGIFVHDGENILYMNEQAAEITGYPREKFKKMSDVLDCLVPGEKEIVTERVRKRMAGEKISDLYDTRIVKSDGSIAVVHLGNTWMTLGGRDVITVMVSDVTARSNAEEAVRTSEERYRALVENSQNVVLVVDPRGKIELANEAASRVAGAPAEDIIGENVYGYLHPDEREKLALQFKKAWSEGVSVSRLPLRTIGGGQDMWFEVTTSVLGDPGQGASVMIIANDVTERETALRKLKESEDRYRTIVEKSRDAIIVSNRAGEVLYANPLAAELAGGPGGGNLVGMHLFQFLHPDERERVALDFISDWKSGETVPNYPMKLLSLDGRVLHVEATSGLVGWPADDAVQIFVIRDVTERRKREEEAELQLKTEEALASISARFIEPADLGEAVLETLAVLGELLGVDRTFYISMEEGGRSAVEITEWRAGGGVTTRKPHPPDRFEKFLPAGDPGELVDVTCSDSRAIEDAKSRERASRLGARAYALMPVASSGISVGVLGFMHGSERECSGHEENLLRQVAGTISRALERQAWIEELENSENFRKTITESIGEGLCVLTDGRITWLNEQACLIHGYQKEEMLGKTAEFLYAEPERLKEVVSGLVEALSSGRIFVTEIQSKRKDGEVIDVMLTVTPLGSTWRKQGELLVALRDITEQKRMSREVAAAAEAYTTLFSSAGDGLVVHTPEGEVIDVNQRVTDYTGLEREEIIGGSVAELIPGERSVHYSERVTEIRQEGVSSFETMLVRKDGGTTPVEITARHTSIFGRDVILSSLRDTTERRRAQEEVQRRATQLASLNEIVKASTSSLDLDTVVEATLEVSMKVTGADNGLMVLEVPPGRGDLKVLGLRGPGEVYKESAYRPHRLKAMLGALRAAGRSFIANIDDFGPDPMGLGIARELENAGIVHGVVMPLMSGEKMIGIMALGAKERGLFNDDYMDFYNAVGAEIGVSIENALIYRELAAEHERLSLLYRSAQSISGEIDIGSLMQATTAEAAKSIGARAAAAVLIDQETGYFVPAAFYNIDPELIRGAGLSSAGGTLGGYIVGTKRAVVVNEGDGLPEGVEDFPLARAVGATSGVGVPLISGDKVVGVLGIFDPKSGKKISDEDVRLIEAMGRQSGVAIQNARLFDETRKHLEALEKAHRELMTLDRMKSDFVSTVSHELRSPLAVIEGFAKTLVEHFDDIDRETERESIEIILKKSIALEGLIENILDMSRIEEGRLDVNLAEVRLADLCEKVLHDQERVAELHEVVFEDGASGAIVRADPEKTEVALANLVRNAIKFAPDGGRIVVRTADAGGYVAVSVEDPGIGIPPHEIEKIFDRFYQADSGETRSFQGAGLGLYITKELVQAMGGNIEVLSAPGEGSTFTISLPRAG